VASVFEGVRTHPVTTRGAGEPQRYIMKGEGIDTRLEEV
jgi:hypothetical protein